MNVIIVSETSQWGGLESHAVALAQALCDAGHQASIVCVGQDSYELYRQAVPDAQFPIRAIFPRRRTVWSWWRAFRDVRADAAILEKGTLLTGGLALDAVLRAKFGRYITIQQLEPPALPQKSSARHFGGLIPGIGLWWYRWQLSGYLRSRAPQFTVCVSDAVKHALAADYSFPERKLVTIHHGVDGRFRHDPEKRRQVRRAWGVPDDAFVFGSIRRFVWDKGLDLAVEAFATLMSRQPECNARLVLIGDGSQQQVLASLAERLGVKDSVIFPGFTPARFM
jgi:glycosyltransferase involved in cell wall biosynthesis